MKMNSKNLIDILPRFVSLLIIAGIIYILYFFYQNVWQIFNISKEAVFLKEKIVPIEINLPLFKKIEGNLEKKKVEKEINLESLRNPFFPLPVSEKIEIQ